MLRTKSALVILLTAFMIAGCGSKTQATDPQATESQVTESQEEQAPTEEDDEQPSFTISNAEFVRTVGECLEDRWTITDSYSGLGQTVPDDELRRAISIEIEAMLPYADQKFEDEAMAAAAKTYIGSLQKMQGILEGISDDREATEYEQEIYQQRKRGLYQINAVEPIPIDTLYLLNLSKLVEEGEVIDAAWSIREAVDFTQYDEQYAWYYYETEVTNDSDIPFTYLSLDLHLYDSDGAEVGTVNCWTDNWAAGETRRLEFSTDCEFETIEIPSMDWTL